MQSKQEQDYKRFLNPLILAKLGNLEIIAKLVVEGFLVGLHKSPYHGFSVEFAEYRQYNPGDPPRTIDWKVFARTDKYYVKEFEEETNLRAYILLDKSGSMGFSHNGRLRKIEYARFLAAALAYLMVKQKDAVGLLTFDKDVDTYIPASMTKVQLMELLKVLDRTDYAEETRIDKTFTALAEKLKRRGLIILISDLLDDPKHTLTALRQFRHKKNEVIVFHILDPSEVNFDFKREAEFIDLESGNKLPVQPWMIREEYRKEVGKFFNELKYGCRELGVDYCLITTDTPFDISLLAYLHKRARLY